MKVSETDTAPVSIDTLKTFDPLWWLGLLDMHLSDLFCACNSPFLLDLGPWTVPPSRKVHIEGICLTVSGL